MKLERLIDLYPQRSANVTHADILAMNRSLNALDDLDIFEPLRQAYIPPGREGAGNPSLASRFDADPVIHGGSELLLAAEVNLGCLNRYMT